MCSLHVCLGQELGQGVSFVERVRHTSQPSFLSSTMLARPPTHAVRAITRASRRTLVTQVSSTPAEPSSSAPPAVATSSDTSTEEPITHFKVTLRRSAISLPEKIKGTVAALGLHKRHQTIYQRHTPEAAGMILRIKELLEVSNVPASVVRSAAEQREERKASRGYSVVGQKIGQIF
jgi:large subunit ribosomal protein L30